MRENSLPKARMGVHVMPYPFRLTLLISCCLLLPSVGAAQEEAVPLDLQQIDLSVVTDRTDLSFEESLAYYAILDHVGHVSPIDLQTAAAELLQQQWKASPRFHQWPLEDFPLFYDLTQRPEEYRGRPITLRGHLVRLVKYAAGPNDFGIETLYEGWLVTPDAQTHPTTVICTEIPAGMPIGEELIDGVSVTGYFFKLNRYSARDRESRFAPMVLARTLSRSPVADAGNKSPLSQPVMIVGLLALACLGVVFALTIARRNRHFKQARVRQTVPDAPPDFLNDLTP